jgi:hypothetical protein
MLPDADVIMTGYSNRDPRRSGVSVPGAGAK